MMNWHCWGVCYHVLLGPLQSPSRAHILNRMCVLSRFSRVQFFATLWNAAHPQAPLSKGFSRQGYWRALPCAPPGHLPNPGIEPLSLALAGRLFTTSTTWEAPLNRTGAGYLFPQQLVSRFTGLWCREQNKLGLHNRFFILTLPGIGLLCLNHVCW